MTRLTESQKNQAYEKGWRDAQNGVFDPPTGDGLVDFVFAPIDALAGTQSTSDEAEALSVYYRNGHMAGSKR